VADAIVLVEEDHDQVALDPEIEAIVEDRDEAAELAPRELVREHVVQRHAGGGLRLDPVPFQVVLEHGGAGETVRGSELLENLGPGRLAGSDRCEPLPLERIPFGVLSANTPTQGGETHQEQQPSHVTHGRAMMISAEFANRTLTEARLDADPASARVLECPPRTPEP
jgi:hypothetical protein